MRQEMPLESHIDIPCSCPSYIESSIVDQAVPFIIFLSRHSELQDRLAAAAGLDGRLETLRSRLDAHKSLIDVLDKQIRDRQERMRALTAWKASLPVSLLWRKTTCPEKRQDYERDCKKLQAKKAEAQEAASICQGNIGHVLKALDARKDLQTALLRKQQKLDCIYQNVFDEKTEHEYSEERSSRAALATATAWSKLCSDQLTTARSAHASLKAALSHAVHCLKALEIAQQSRVNSSVMSTSNSTLYSTSLKRALCHEKEYKTCLEQAKAFDPLIAPSIPMPDLLSTFGPSLEPKNSWIRQSLSGSSMWMPGSGLYRQVSQILPNVQRAVHSLMREHLRLCARMEGRGMQLHVAQIQVMNATDRLRNVRRTIFIDTLLGQDVESSLVDPVAFDQDRYTLMTWLKDADEAGRLSAPTSASLSLALKQADQEGLPEY